MTEYRSRHGQAGGDGETARAPASRAPGRTTLVERAVGVGRPREAASAEGTGETASAPPVPARVAHLISEADWTELWTLAHPDGTRAVDPAGARAAVERFVERMRPRLVHSAESRSAAGSDGNHPYTDPGRNLAPVQVGTDDDGRGVYDVDGCHESAYIIQEALGPLGLGIAVEIRWMGSHRTVSFPELGNLALFHGDDLHTEHLPFELVPLAVVETYWRQAANLELMRSLMPRGENDARYRAIFEAAMPAETVAVPGAGGAVFEVTHLEWLARVSDAALAAIVRREAMNPTRPSTEDIREEVCAPVHALAGDLTRLAGLVPSPPERIPCGEDGLLRYVVGDGGLPRSHEEAVEILARRVEAMAISGAMAGGEIPDSTRREMARDPFR